MKRIDSLDLVKFVAILFVPCVHFFLNNGFYNTSIKGWSMLLSVFLRWIFYLAVPLFIILTGYLMKDKKIDKNYYKKLIKLVLSYLFISILCILFRKYYLKEELTFLTSFVSIFNFTACEYAWYVEMYLGLFLLIPFLNILYKEVENKKSLFITLLLLCSIPPFVNHFRIGDVHIPIMPDWWMDIYPILYYFIGCYIKEKEIHVNKKKYLSFFFLGVILETLIAFHYNYKMHYSTTFLVGYGCLQTVVLATIFFLLLYDINIKNKKVSKVITSISKNSLDIYLFSYIVDKITYLKLSEYLHTPREYIRFILPITLGIFIVSCTLAYIKKIIFDGFEKLVRKIGKKRIS